MLCFLKLGEKRGTLSEQRQFLTRISTIFRDICKAAVDGRYDQEYFSAEPEVMIRRRLRALIQKLHIEYADVLREAAHTYKMVNKATPDTAKAVLR